MTHKTNVPQQETMIQLLTVLFPSAKIYLFGSRARGDYTERSDIDIAIDLGRQMEFREIARARGVLEGLNLPWKIDVVDMYSISETMKEFITKEGIIWKSKYDDLLKIHEALAISIELYKKALADKNIDDEISEAFRDSVIKRFELTYVAVDIQKHHDVIDTIIKKVSLDTIGK